MGIPLGCCKTGIYYLNVIAVCTASCHHHRASCHQRRACTVTFFFFCNTMAVAISTTVSSPCRATTGHHHSGHSVDGVTSWYWPCVSHCRCRCHRCMVVATSLSLPSLSCAGGHAFGATVSSWHWPRASRRCRCVVVAALLLPSSRRSRCVLVATALPSSSPSLCGGSHFIDVVAVAAWWWQRRYCHCRHRCAVVATTPRTSRRCRHRDAMALATHAPSSSS